MPEERQFGRARTNKEGHTILYLDFEYIYACRYTLFGITPNKPSILRYAAEPLAHKPCQSRLEWSAARVVG